MLRKLLVAYEDLRGESRISLSVNGAPALGIGFHHLDNSGYRETLVHRRYRRCHHPDLVHRSTMRRKPPFAKVASQITDVPFFQELPNHLCHAFGITRVEGDLDEIAEITHGDVVGSSIAVPANNAIRIEQFPLAIRRQTEALQQFVDDI